MKLKDLFDLDSKLLIQFMREEGIVSLAADGHSITLSQGTPPVKVKELEPSRFDDDGDKEKLPCGHSIWEANELNECLHGCEGEPKVEDKQ